MSTEETIRQAEVISDQIAVVAAELQKRNAAREFESIWTKAMETQAPEMKQIEYLKKIFGLYFAEAYRIGAVDMAVFALDWRRRRENEPL